MSGCNSLKDDTTLLFTYPSLLVGATLLRDNAELHLQRCQHVPLGLLVGK